MTLNAFHGETVAQADWKVPFGYHSDKVFYMRDIQIGSIGASFW